jgi:putative hydrolase of the HAD superfamily
MTQLVFDFGGVVFRWRPAELVAKVWPHRARSEAELAHTVAELFQAYTGDWGRFDQGLLDEQGLIDAVCARTLWPRADMVALLAAVPDELVPQADVVALLDALRGQGHRLVYLSNMPAPLAKHLERSYPLRMWFGDGLFSSHELLCKPAPALFARAAVRFGRLPGDCLLIDDHPVNIEAARACGWQAEWFNGADRLAQRLRERGLLR